MPLSLQLLDKYLGQFTMYKIVLLALSCFALSGFFIHNPLNYLISLILLLSTSFLFHLFFSKKFKAFPNNESWLITALILVCLLDPSDYLFLILASFLAVASKYLFAYRSTHIFNPAAFSAFVLTSIGSANATWWIGSRPLLPLVAIFGLLVARKLRRQTMVLVFLAITSLFALLQGLPLSMLWVSGPLVFFATIMFTEPLTTPPTRLSQLFYALLVGIWLTQYFRIGPFHGGAEFALLLGNLVAFIFWRRQKVILTLKKILPIATDTYNFEFSTNQKIAFLPGQYLEWTIPHPNPDLRGSRRWFSLASSPTEDIISLGTKILTGKSSSLKKHLLSLSPGQQIEAHQAQGDFVLPKDKTKKLALIAGGIGITPFRSMVKYLEDTQDKRDLVLLYANNDDKFAYRDVFDKIRTIYHNTSTSGYVTVEFIQKNIPDYLSRHFYISGPPAMVDSYKKILDDLKIKHIHTDYFPGC